MTLGQRIAQKRKELGLSQEGLGEQLGVSRQAIYKWESDSSLPEIDKLISLSKIFSVSVGWLLGLEETPQPQQAAPPPEELTETQLQMVQEIVDRYLAAQPQPALPRRRRLTKLLGAAGGLVLIVSLLSLFSKLDRVTQDYNNLRYSMDHVSQNVNSQIGSITNRVEDILKSQNALTAEWSTELAYTDPAANTAAFNIRVVPKTYVEGMTALFVARSGEETVELPVEPGEDHAFSGQITCPLTDDISLTVVFLTGGKRETQWLEDYSDLYIWSFPWLTILDNLWSDTVFLKDNLLAASASNQAAVEIWNEDMEDKYLSWNPEPPAKLQVGLFRDQKLVLWYEGRTYSANWNGVPTEIYAWFRPREVTLEPGHVYCEAAVYTDEYGRQQIYPGKSIAYDASKQSWDSAYLDTSGADLAGWEF